MRYTPLVLLLLTPAACYASPEAPLAPSAFEMPGGPWAVSHGRYTVFPEPDRAPPFREHRYREFAQPGQPPGPPPQQQRQQQRPQAPQQRQPAPQPPPGGGGGPPPPGGGSNMLPPEGGRG